MNTIFPSTTSIQRSPGRTTLLLIPLLSICVVFSHAANAVSPPPDGGYPGGNTAEGQDALLTLTTGTYNTALGFGALRSNRTGSFNTAVGAGALFNNTADQNTATGAAALLNNTTGSLNTANGEAALFSNTIGIQNTANGASALESNTTGRNNTATGVDALFGNIAGNNNTATGGQALFENTTGLRNTANGANALRNNTTGNNNTATGFQAMLNTRGGDNTAIGADTLFANTTGSFNIALGSSAGSNLTTGNNNIDIGYNVSGTAGESSTIRIGAPQVISACYIAGISNQTATNGSAVFIDANGKLGTLTSSAQFKDDVKPMDTASESILALKPLTFRYKKEIDAQRTPQFGLVAEEVEKVNPHLVVRDKEGKPYAVRYEQVNAMLLNEFLKAHRKIQEQEAAIARQQKQLEALAAGLQKVSARLEASHPTNQLVLKNR
jgi:Chaperone of endosialidase